MQEKITPKQANRAATSPHIQAGGNAKVPAERPPVRHISTVQQVIEAAVAEAQRTFQRISYR